MGSQQRRRKLAKKVAQVGHVPQQHALCVVVARCVYCLRQVDDDWNVLLVNAGQQDVELRQIPMHHPRAQHAHHLANQRGVMRQGLGWRKGHIVQARCCVAFSVGHQFHQQHAIVKVVRLRHAHARASQPVQGIYLGALPGRFLLLPAKLAALGHGPGRARVFDLAVFGVVHRLAKAALVRLFVNLGAHRVVAAAHHKHHRLLAAHQLAHNRVNQAFFNERLESGGSLHGVIVRDSGGVLVGSNCLGVSR